MTFFKLYGEHYFKTGIKYDRLSTVEYVGSSKKLLQIKNNNNKDGDNEEINFKCINIQVKKQ